MADKDKPWLNMPIIRAAPSTEAVSAEQPEETPSVDEYGRPMPTLATAPTPPTSLSDFRDQIQQADMAALTALQPGPDAGMVERFGRRAGQLGVHLLSGAAQVPINMLLGATQGPGGVTINPETNTFGATPELQAAASGGAGGLRFSRGAPLMREPQSPFTLTKPPPVTLDELNAAISRADEKPAPPPKAPLPPEAAPTESQPTGATPAATSTSAGARAVADAYYDTFDAAARGNGSLTPNVANKVVEAFESRLDPEGMGQALGGEELRGIVKKLQDYRDKPMSLKDVQAVDTRLGDLIHKEHDPIKGMSSLGRQLEEIQDAVRGITENPAPGDITGGQAGLDALAPARQAYAASKRMQEVERLWERAQGTQNPRTSFQIQVRNLLDNKRRSAGFNDEERAALKEAARIGIGPGGFVHFLGSRIIPAIAGAVEAGTHGVTAGAAAAATTYALGSGARKLENRIATGKYETARGVLGQRVPPLRIAPNDLFP